MLWINKANLSHAAGSFKILRFKILRKKYLRRLSSNEQVKDWEASVSVWSKSHRKRQSRILVDNYNTDNYTNHDDQEDNCNTENGNDYDNNDDSVIIIFIIIFTIAVDVINNFITLVLIITIWRIWVSLQSNPSVITPN